MDQFLEGQFWVAFAYAVVALLALGVSVYTLYMTQIRQFKGVVIPSRRMALTWMVTDEGDDPENPIINDCRSIVLECEFINQGAKAGHIDDLLAEFTDTDGGEHIIYKPFLITNQIDLAVDRTQNDQGLSDFSTVWLNPQACRHMNVFFMPSGNEKGSQDKGSLEPNQYKVKLLFGGSTGESLSCSPGDFTITLNKEMLDKWNDKKTVAIEADQLKRRRKKYFGK